MSIGPVEFCNLALYKIGEKTPLTTWPDPSTNGEICKIFFDNLLEEVLESEDWKCAMTSAQLAQLTDAPALEEFDHQYALPNDCLRPVLVCNELGVEFTAKWEQEGRNILTSEDEVYLKYIKRELDLNKWTATLRRIFVVRMAIDLCKPVTGESGSINDLAIELTEIAIPQAEISNARLGQVEESGETLAIEAGR